MGNSLELARTVGERLVASGDTLATAESCSGGLIANLITDMPGASVYYAGGIVAYSNETKIALLDVDPDSIRLYGAVSEAVARQMAEGVRSRLGTDYGIGVTGIAGPSGGSLEKPVGLVYIAVAGHDGGVVDRNLFTGSRVTIKEKTAQRALEILLELLS